MVFEPANKVGALRNLVANRFLGFTEQSRIKPPNSSNFLLPFGPEDWLYE